MQSDIFENSEKCASLIFIIIAILVRNKIARKKTRQVRLYFKALYNTDIRHCDIYREIS